MSYQKQGFVANETVVTAAALNHMEDGIARASEDARRPCNYATDGRDLSEVFEDAAALRAALAAEDYSGIRVGDCWPVTLSGAFRDYGAYTVPAGTAYFADAALATPGGTTASVGEGQYESATAVRFKVSGADAYCALGDCLPYFERTLSNAVLRLEVAGINNYWRYGDSGALTGDRPHLTFVSRDCLPVYLRMRKGRTVTENPEEPNPWRGSALFRTLNDPDYGIVRLIEATDIGAHLYAGPNGGGMRAMLEKRNAGTQAVSGWEWTSRGKLFLPFESEVWGHAVFANHANCLGAGLQLPIFAGSRRHISKGIGDGGARCYWWTASQAVHADVLYCNVANGAHPNQSNPVNSNGVPVCFVMA